MNSVRWCTVPNNETERIQNEQALIKWFNTKNINAILQKMTNDNLRRRLQHDDMRSLTDEIGMAFCNHMGEVEPVQWFSDYSEAGKVWTLDFKKWFDDLCKEIKQKREQKKKARNKMIKDNNNYIKRIAELEARIEELEWSPEPGPKYKALHSCQTRFKVIKLEKQ